MTATTAEATRERHPRGLYVLFATEMWERFGFYAMLAMLTLYMRDSVEGFGWTTEKATNIYSWYQAFVYATPLIGGWLADRFLGYRNAITIGAVLFGAGYFMLAVPHNVPLFYAALLMLVLGNGFFKPNVSSIVGNLYQEGSHLKDRAYLIFYMGINIGAFVSPLVAEVVHDRYGFNPAFSVSGFGMIICLIVFWGFRSTTRYADRPRVHDQPVAGPNAAAVTADKPPAAATEKSALEMVPEWKRIAALIVIFLLVIVFWMVFQQNGSTFTFWANDNTAWNVTGIISNAINPFWIITLSLPLAWFWGWLDRRGLEPSTPTKMALGMVFTGISLLVLYFGALAGGYTVPSTRIEKAGPAPGQYWVHIPEGLRSKVGITTAPTAIEVTRSSGGTTAQTKVNAYPATSDQSFKELDLAGIEAAGNGQVRLVPLRRVSPAWLVIAYLLISLGELMLSPMGLALVSKVAPPRMRGLMMGGWFLATAIGNKLTAIGVFWDVWSHAKFFLTLSLMAFAMAVVLFVLIIPLKKAMPGV